MHKDGVTVKTSVGDCFIAAAIVALGLVMVVGARAMALGNLAMPGPGFFPMVLGIVLIAAGALIFVRAALKLRSIVATEDLFQRNVGVALLTLVWIGFTFERLGAEIAFAGFLLVWLRTYARLKWPVAIVAAIAISLATCWTFRSVLGVNLPRGMLGPG